MPRPSLEAHQGQIDGNWRVDEQEHVGICCAHAPSDQYRQWNVSQIVHTCLTSINGLNIEQENAKRQTGSDDLPLVPVVNGKVHEWTQAVESRYPDCAETIVSK